MIKIINFDSPGKIKKILDHLQIDNPYVSLKQKMDERLKFLLELNPSMNYHINLLQTDEIDIKREVSMGKQAKELDFDHNLEMQRSQSLKITSSIS